MSALPLPAHPSAPTPALKMPAAVPESVGLPALAASASVARTGQLPKVESVALRVFEGEYQGHQAGRLRIVYVTNAAGTQVSGSFTPTGQSEGYRLAGYMDPKGPVLWTHELPAVAAPALLFQGQTWRGEALSGIWVQRGSEQGALMQYQGSPIRGTWTVAPPLASPR